MKFKIKNVKEYTISIVIVFLGMYLVNYASVKAEERSLAKTNENHNNKLAQLLEELKQVKKSDNEELYKVRLSSLKIEYEIDLAIPTVKIKKELENEILKYYDKPPVPDAGMIDIYNKLKKQGILLK